MARFGEISCLSSVVVLLMVQAAFSQSSDMFGLSSSMDLYASESTATPMMTSAADPSTVPIELSTTVELGSSSTTEIVAMTPSSSSSSVGVVASTSQMVQATTTVAPSSSTAGVGSSSTTVGISVVAASSSTAAASSSPAAASSSSAATSSPTAALSSAPVGVSISAADLSSSVDSSTSSIGDAGVITPSPSSSVQPYATPGLGYQVCNANENHCQNSGTCIIPVNQGTKQCQCTKDYFGEKCETNGDKLKTATIVCGVFLGVMFLIIVGLVIALCKLKNNRTGSKDFDG